MQSEVINALKSDIVKYNSDNFLGLDKKIIRLIYRTFDNNSKRLPYSRQIKPLIESRFEFSLRAGSLHGNILTPQIVREIYTRFCYVAYTHELLMAIKKLVKAYDFKIIYELCCGPGWFTYWLRQYKIPVTAAVDNHRWPAFKSKYMNFVKKEDAVKFVREKKHRSGDMYIHYDKFLYIISYPYMDDVAYRVWKAMPTGSYLLYIGEDTGGCTADNSFFQAVNGHEVHDKYTKEIKNAFIQFQGLHDKPRLFKK